MDDPLTSPASLNAARIGARVIIRTPQGSRYDEQTGTIRAVSDGTATVMLDGPVPWQRPTLPFAFGELVALSSVTREQRPDWPVDFEQGE